jgi:tricorn protease
MVPSRPLLRLLACAGLLLGAVRAPAAPSFPPGGPGADRGAPSAGETRLLRYPDLQGGRVAFTYGGDLWTAPAAGGAATRLTAHSGLELFPKYSPDGRWIAFTGQYDGDEQVFVMPADGGPPRQLTFYPAYGPLAPWAGYDNQVLGWTPDSRSILFRSLREADGALRNGTLYTVDVGGGPVRRLPLATAGPGAIGPDGATLAYAPVARDFNPWKRYRGGQDQGLRRLDLATGAGRAVAPGLSGAGHPLWAGDRLCFTADAGGVANLFQEEPDGTVRQLTFSRDWDVRWPSGDRAGRIVYESGGALRILDRAGGSDRALVITVPTDSSATRPVRLPAPAEDWGLAPDGEQAVVVARGDVFVMPVQGGPARNLTRSPGAHDRLARWSPDGRTLAFVSDRTGEDQVYRMDAAGRTPPVQLTTGLRTFLASLTWAPDSVHLALVAKDGQVLVAGPGPGPPVPVARDPGGGSVGLAWSPDSRYLALSLANPNRTASIHVWDRLGGRLRRVTPDWYSAWAPAWDPAGGLIYFLARRDYGARLGSVDYQFAPAGNTGVFALVLGRGRPHPFPPAGSPAAPGPAAGTAIDWDGLDQRVVRVPVAAGDLGPLAAVPGRLLYGRGQPVLFGHEDEGRTALCQFDLQSRRETVLAPDLAGWRVSADGSRVLGTDGSAHLVLGTGPEPSRQTLGLGRLTVDCVPRLEWEEIFREVWRRYRDFFYARNMHGLDWAALGEKYRPFLRHVVHRSDLTGLLSELVGELSVGHAFLGAGDDGQPPRPRAALPGARLELDPAAGRWRIARIYRGQNEEPLYRSPLTEVGVDAREGDYLLAIDGAELAGSDSPYRLLRGRTGPVTFTLNARPVHEGAREVAFNPVESERNLRYLDFVLRSRETVERLSGGRVGYLHLPDLGARGLGEFIKWYYPQVRKDGLVVDLRGNEGGTASELVLERLGRRLAGLSFGSGPRPETYPDTVFCGPMAGLVNETTMSDGEVLAYHFRGQGLGPLVGRRTWGGVVGVRNQEPLVDGSTVEVPEVGTAGPDGHWIIEGEGVSPDLEVAADPGALLAGRDLQLERAVAEVLEALAGRRPGLPPRPDDPVRVAPAAESR